MAQPMNQPTDDQPQRRVVLPNGDAIDVLLVERASPAELHVCPECASGLVLPLAWAEAGRTRWDVTLHCPNCDWLGRGVYDETLVERFDEELDRGTEVLVRDLQRLMRANMEDDVERFVAALRAGAILPEDF
jgi:hypothetical protein